MKAGVVVDDWKLPVFRRRLEAAGFEYVDGGAPAPGITALTIQLASAKMLDLARVVAEAQQECDTGRCA